MSLPVVGAVCHALVRSKDVLKKQIAIKFALNIHSPKRVVPDDDGDPDLLPTRPKPPFVHKKYENLMTRLA